MKHTKRPLSLLLTLCLLLGLLPTTVWAVSALEIKEQPTADNNYTVKATYMGQEMTDGFQWYKKVDTATTYTLVQENPQGNQLAADEINSGSYTGGHWAAENERDYIDIRYLSAPSDQLTITILTGGSKPYVTDDAHDIYLPTEVSPGVYTVMSAGGMLDISIDNDDRAVPTTAIITVKRSWAPVAGQTSPSLTATEFGTYYCAVTRPDPGHTFAGLISDTVTILSPEDQATADWLDYGYILALGPTEVTAENFKDILGDGTASFEVANGTPTLTLNGVTVTEGYDFMGFLGGVFCIDALTIVLAEGSVNKITINDAGGHDAASGVTLMTMSEDDSIVPYLTITGKGKLEVSFTSSNADAMQLSGVLANNIHVTGGAEFTVMSSTPSQPNHPGDDDNTPVFSGLSCLENTLKVSDGGVVKVSSTSMAAVILDGYRFDGAPSGQVLADGYSIQGSASVNDFTNLADAELKEVEMINGSVLTLKVGDDVAKSVVIAPIHNHRWQTGIWISNATHHWHSCTAPGCPITDPAGKDGYAPHIYNDVQDVRCSVCASVRHYHTWSTSWITDDTHHWHKCTAPGCPVTDPDRKNGYAPHSGGTATCTAKAVCTACTIPYGELAAHDFTGDYLSDADGHWHKCKTCTATGPKAGHVYAGDQDPTCDDCGYIRTVVSSHTHIWAEAWSGDRRGHWHSCTAPDCDIADYAICGQAGAAYAVHIEDSGTVTKPATNTEKGVKTFKCTVCGRVLRTEDIPTLTYSISGSVTDKGGSTVSGAAVKLMRGSTQIGQTTAGPSGEYSFSNVPAGTYNVVVEQGGGDDKITKTILVVLTDSDATGKNVKLPDGRKNSVVEVKEGTPDVVVGGVDQVAEAQVVAPDQTVTIKLTVEKKEENAAAGADDIKRIAGGKTVEFLELSLVREVTGGANDGTTSITDTQDKVLEIVVPYDFSHKSSVTVYRHHDGKAEALASANTNAKGTFRLDETNGLIYIYATKFSTYAIGYNASGSETPDPTPTPTPPSSGSSGGGSSSPATYTPIIEKSGHGKVECKPRSPERGEKVTVTLTPDKGWQIDGFTVTDRNGKPVAVTGGDSGIYTFTQPTGKVTIKAGFKPISGATTSCPKDSTCPIWPYEDSDPGAQYHDGVHYCLEHGLMVGIDSRTFAPDGSTSRAMVAAILWRLEGSPVVDCALPFSDVLGDVWYTEPIRWAVASGVASGYGDGTFGPGDSITREQMAIMLWQCAGSPAAHQTLSFTDAERISGYALEAVRWAVEKGIVIGCGDGRFDPQGLTTRAQAAAMLQRFCERKP